MGQESESCFDYMAMFAFCDANVFRSVWWTYIVRYAIKIEVRFKLYILSTTISVEGFNFVGKHFFNLRMKLWKYGDNFSFTFQRINPRITCKVINEHKIIFVAIYKSNGRGSPNIRKNKFKRSW